MKLVGANISSLNGALFFENNKDVIKVSYGTPHFNDYNEWRIDELQLYKDVNIKEYTCNLIFDVDVSNINLDNLNNIIKELEGESDDDNTLMYEMLTFVEYRAPTKEEMEYEGNTIEDYKVGKFIFAGEDREESKFEEFKPNDEITNLSLIVLNGLLDNKDKIYKTKPQIFL